MGKLTKQEPETAPEEEITGKSGDNSSGFYCYIGPGLPGLLSHGTVFRGSRAEALAAAAPAIEKYPKVAQLIVSGDELAALRLKAKTPGNALYEACRKVSRRG